MPWFKTSLAAGAVMAAALAGAAQAKTLRVAIEGAFPPFNEIDASGKLVGLDVDIANAICADLKMECELKAQAWDGIIPGLLAKKYDAIVSDMSITEKRKKSVDFTAPYYSNKLQFVGPKGKDIPLDAASLKGKAIGAQRSTISAEWLEKNRPGSDIKQYANKNQTFLDLASGRIDLVLGDVYQNYGYLRTEEGKKFEFKGEPVFEGDKIAIAVRKGDPLRDKISASIKHLRDSGEYAKINAKYFPFDIY